MTVAPAQVITFRAGDAGAVLESLRTLRDRTARAESAPWHAELSGFQDPQVLFHLAPPETADRPDVLRSWRTAFRYGLLHYRRGPGFLVVHDARPGARSPRTIVDDPQAVAMLDENAGPLPLPSGRSPAIRELLDSRLLLVMGGHAIPLPYRLQRLPLPVEVLGHG
jgi:hypothetical protein